MRNRYFAAIFCTLLIAPAAQAVAAQGDDFTERDEFHQTYQLSPGATVSVENISGPVEIETWDGDQAEVHVVRSARTREALEHKRVLVEQTSSSLSVHGERHKGMNGNRAQVRQEVTLKIPRRVALSVGDVAGRLTVGAIDGDLTVSDIAGRVTIAGVNGSPRISDIAGSLDLAVGELGASGLDISDIAGRVELRLAGVSGAEVDISDISGSIDVDVPAVTTVGKVDREHFRGRIGAGGPRISVTDIAGSVRVTQ